jgi:hypothetical protein
MRTDISALPQKQAGISAHLPLRSGGQERRTPVANVLILPRDTGRDYRTSALCHKSGRECHTPDLAQYLTDWERRTPVTIASGSARVTGRDYRTSALYHRLDMERRTLVLTQLQVWSNALRSWPNSEQGWPHTLQQISRECRILTFYVLKQLFHWTYYSEYYICPVTT